MQVNLNTARFHHSPDPFPHWVILGLWDDDDLRAIREEFPAADDGRWVTYAEPEEYGKKAAGENAWGPRTKDFFETVRSNEFCNLIETATGLSPLTADTVGGGMHETGEGGRLEMHVDFNVHPDNPSLERRMNLLTFLNEEWDSEWGGTLYLGAEKEVAVRPVIGAVVLFECSDKSFHGHPEPIVGGHLRRSLACYYYAPARENVTAHTTLWVG